MNYKELFHITLTLISSPARAWEEISLQDRRQVLTSFVYPMIGLCGLSVLIGSLVNNGWGGPQSYQIAMTACCGVAVALFGGYYLSSFLINGIRVRFFKLPSDNALSGQFAGYSLVMIFLAYFVMGILPDLFVFMLLVQLYTVYIVWEGSKQLTSLDDSRRMQFTMLVSAVLILSPAFIGKLFGWLTQVLR